MIAIACNTNQYFKDKITDICNKFGAIFFNMEDSVDKYLTENRITTFDFLAIEFTSDFNYWSGFKKLAIKYNIKIPAEDKIKEISEIGYNVKQGGITSTGINKLRDLINSATTTDTV